MDSGIQADHPEFQDANGNTRVQQIDWYAASGLTGTMPPGHYTDYDGLVVRIVQVFVPEKLMVGQRTQEFMQ